MGVLGDKLLPCRLMSFEAPLSMIPSLPAAWANR